MIQNKKNGQPAGPAGAAADLEKNRRRLAAASGLRDGDAHSRRIQYIYKPS